MASERNGGTLPNMVLDHLITGGDDPIYGKGHIKDKLVAARDLMDGGGYNHLLNAVRIDREAIDQILPLIAGGMVAYAKGKKDAASELRIIESAKDGEIQSLKNRLATLGADKQRLEARLLESEELVEELREQVDNWSDPLEHARVNLLDLNTMPNGATVTVEASEIRITIPR